MTSPPSNRRPVASRLETAPSLSPPVLFHAAPLVELIRSIAHDLRTPIGVVAQSLAALHGHGALEAGAEMESLGASLDERRLLLSLADCSIRRLSRMADTLTLLAALEAPGFALQLQRLDLADLVREASASAVALEPRREIQVECDVGSTPLPAIVDRARLTYAMTELTINAIRHARGRVRIALEHRDGSARITIEDDGSGVPEERCPTLFHRLTGRPSGSGLGVGVSLAKDIVRAHHGSLKLAPSALPEGRPGTVGAGFVCAFPLELAKTVPIEAPRASPPEVAQAPAAALRVLLVDDQPDLRELLRIVLERRGFIVTAARSMAAALERAAAERFDVLVSDVSLPDGTGWDLLRRVRADHSIPAIAMSGAEGEAHLATTRDAGFDEHFTKPVRVEQLMSAIRRVVAAGPASGREPAGVDR